MNGEEQRMANNRKAVRHAQMKEMLYVGYFLWFAIEYFIKAATCNIGDEYSIIDGLKYVYHKVSFVVEQDKRQKFSGWENRRHHFEWLRYL